MLAKLFLVFLIVPLIELALLFKISSIIGIWITLAVIIGTAMLGASLARREGLKTWWRLQDKLTQGMLPDEELLDGILILVAAAVLLTPGFLTDATGFFLLFPGTRQLVKGALRATLRRRIDLTFQAGFVNRGPFNARQVNDWEPPHRADSDARSGPARSERWRSD